ncbi:DUF934 domain-containing protein [Frigidibacter sp. SLM-1]|nr:DUF934 domain-containing protein [Frigidibacter sp. ROC022]MCR8726319.1 DUF934 domain-containing protein [Frigidibacter sp. ROC022]
MPAPRPVLVRNDEHAPQEDTADATPAPQPDAPVIVTDQGFAADDWSHPVTPLAEFSGPTGPVTAIEIGPEDDPQLLARHLPEIDMIRVRFPSFSDGRGFTHARQLRLMGFQGRLRAAGPVIADQYAMARRSGFDEVEIPAELARRQPWPQWQRRANWRAHDYQSRLRA